MSRSLWISSLALVLLSGTTAGADDATELQVGPVRLKVQAEATQLHGQPVQVYVQATKLDGQPVQVQVRGRDLLGTPLPVDVQVKQAPGEVIQVQAAPGQAGTDPMAVPGGAELKLGEYWLGLACSPAGAALRAQLDLSKDHGLVVDQVVPDSPAAKAEIKPHDVLVKAGDKSLKNVQDLIDAVQSAQEKKLSIELIRGGKRREVTVTPAKRPEQAQPGITPQEAFKKWLEELHRPGTELDDATKRALEYLERMQQGEALKGPLRWRIFGPGAILPPGPRFALPADMTVTITKQGDKPAKITVKQGKERWETTEDELDKLPEKVRPYVERMLGRVVVDGPMRPVSPRLKIVPEPTAPGQPEGGPEARLGSRLEKRLEQMNKRIEQLQKSIEELRGKRSRAGQTPKENSDQP
jgi:membrane-associated protease RseP (regulator of RpoE activity)